MWKQFRFDPRALHFSSESEEKHNEFDQLLHSEWNRALAQGLFTFQIGQELKQRTLEDGDLHYIIELNPNRFEKRRMPYPFERVDTPFDKTKFNFNQIRDEEILFSLDTEEQKNRHLVIINNSPIRPFHVLLVPDRQLEQTQILTVDGLRFGYEFVTSSAHPFVYVGFNSLCGYASINHFHLHGLYMPDRLFLQTAKCSPFHTGSNCYLFDLFAVEAFAFEIKDNDQFPDVARRVHTITSYLTSANVAHNLSIIKGHSFSSTEPAIRIFVWFRQSNIGAKLCDRCNFACLELSGYMFLRYEHVFHELTEKELRQLMNEIALPLEECQTIKNDVKSRLDA